jgi:hypothetical protein
MFGQQLPYAKENNFQTDGFLSEEPENRPISRLTKHLLPLTLAPHLLLLERELFISERFSGGTGLKHGKFSNCT